MGGYLGEYYAGDKFRGMLGGYQWLRMFKHNEGTGLF